MRKTWMAALCVLLAAALSIGGTMAYLTDSDSDVNVMELGDVDIVQIEEQRDGNGGRVEFAGKQENGGSVRLLPGVYLEGLDKDDEGFYNANVFNAVDKIVSVKNEGGSPAYVRTMFAFEQGTLTADELEALLIINWNDAVTPELVGTDVVIDGHEGKLYTVYQVVYPEALTSGETTEESLLQVLLSKDADRAEMDALDPDGDKLYEILVVSQAVQAEGFESVGAERALEEAFGKSFPGTQEYRTVNNVEELAAALEKGGKIKLGTNMTWTLENHFTQSNEVVLDLNGNALTLVRDATLTEWGQWQVKAPLTVEDSVGNGSLTASVIQFYVYDTMNIIGGTVSADITPIIIAQNGELNVNGDNAKVYCQGSAAINVLESNAKANVYAGTVEGYTGIAVTAPNGQVKIMGGTVKGTYSDNAGVIINKDSAKVIISGAPAIEGVQQDIILQNGNLDLRNLTGNNSYTIAKTGGDYVAPSYDAWNTSANSNGSSTIITIVPNN